MVSVSQCSEEEVESLGFDLTADWQNANATKAGQQEVMERIANVVGILVAGIIDLFAIVGNLLVLSCLCRRKRLTSMLVILYGLAAVDSLVLIMHLVFQVVANLNNLLPQAEQFASHVKLLTMSAWPFSQAAHSIGILLTVFICVERWFAVCRPLRVRSLLPLGRTKRLLVGIVVLGTMLNVPRFFEYRKCIILTSNSNNNANNDNNNNSTDREGEGEGEQSENSYQTDLGWVDVKTDFGRSFLYSTLYCMILYEFTVYLMPLCALTCMTGHMLVRIRHFHTRCRKLSNSQQREHRIAALPICIVIIFIVCETPTIIINFLDAYSIAVNRDVMYFLMGCSGFLVVFKCALNIVAYSLYSSILRGEMSNFVNLIKPNLRKRSRARVRRTATSTPLVCIENVAATATATAAPSQHCYTTSYA